MNQTERETAVFRSLAQSGEGQVIASYLKRQADKVVFEAVEKEKPDIEEVQGAKLTRKYLLKLADRFIDRDTINADVTRFD